MIRTVAEMAMPTWLIPISYADMADPDQVNDIGYHHPPDGSLCPTPSDAMPVLHLVDDKVSPEHEQGDQSRNEEIKLPGGAGKRH